MNAESQEGAVAPAPVAAKPEEFKVAGRTFFRLPNGDLREKADPIGHAERTLAAISKNYVLAGARLTPADKPEQGVTVAFDEAESAEVVEAIKAVLAKRIEKLREEAEDEDVAA